MTRLGLAHGRFIKEGVCVWSISPKGCVVSPDTWGCMIGFIKEGIQSYKYFESNLVCFIKKNPNLISH
jgi:hypothetical protein